MNVVSNAFELEAFLQTAQQVSAEYPVVVSEFIQEAKEVELDAVADHGDIISYAISEHVEFAGVHSGDAHHVLPPQRVYVGTIRKLKNITEKIARRYQISGPFNIQFLEKDGIIRVIECNIRASRSFPFVSKISGNNLITKATQGAAGQKRHRPRRQRARVRPALRGRESPAILFHPPAWCRPGAARGHGKHRRSRLPGRHRRGGPAQSDAERGLQNPGENGAHLGRPPSSRK
ncbi:MAG: ATP-grasp domain-containing protein [Hymenobacter sp.]